MSAIWKRFFVMKNYANGPSIFEGVEFVMKNYANGPSIGVLNLSRKIMQMGVVLERVRFVMKNYANGPSIWKELNLS